VSALATSDDFPGWLAPLTFNPQVLADFTS